MEKKKVKKAAQKGGRASAKTKKSASVKPKAARKERVKTKFEDVVIKVKLKDLQKDPDTIVKKTVAAMKKNKPKLKKMWSRPDEQDDVLRICEMEQRWRYEIAQ